VSFLLRLGGLDLQALPLLQRILLVSDGTLTDTIEAAFLEQIGVRKTAVDVSAVTSRIDALDLDVGHAAMRRSIVLFGKSTGRSYLYAESLIAVDRLPPRFREELLESDKPLGRLWVDHKLETYKELLVVTRRAVGDLARHFEAYKPNREFLVRTYRVISGARPLMLITEYVPDSYD